MTGFGDACAESAGTSVFVEIRSINNRYFKATLRCNETLGALEPQVEDEIRKQVARGTITVNFRITRQPTADTYRLNLPLLSAYRQQLMDWSRENETLDNVSQLDVTKLITLPGVVMDNSATDDNSAIASPLMDALHQALDKMIAMRVREGKALAADLLSHLGVVKSHLENVVARAPEISKIFSERMVERLNRLFEQQGVELAQADIIREVGIFADKCDISEEISRLKSHFVQFESILAKDPSPGKKLDFLTQELFREINTIGSKANDFAISQEVIAMKASVERIREQVQNIE